MLFSFWPGLVHMDDALTGGFGIPFGGCFMGEGDRIGWVLGISTVCTHFFEGA